jgi:hypothetical protein
VPVVFFALSFSTLAGAVVPCWVAEGSLELTLSEIGEHHGLQVVYG